MVWTIVIVNILAAVLLMFWAKQVAQIAFIPHHLIVPGVILCIFMGAWLGENVSTGSWISALLFGAIGYTMKVSGWARPPLVLGLILGTIVENRFLLATNAHGGYCWLTRPLVLIILCLILVTLVLAAPGVVKNTEKTDSEQQYGEGRASNPAISLPFSGIILSIFTVAAVLALEWPPEVRLFPITVAIPGPILAALTIFLDGRTFRETLPGFSSLGAMLSEASQKAALSKLLLFILILGVMIAVMLFLGQKLALPLFIFT